MPLPEPAKTGYKYIQFFKTADTGKTSVWSCLNRKSNVILGTVAWSGQWRQYVYRPMEGTEYSAGCERDIAQFMDHLRRVEMGDAI